MAVSCSRCRGFLSPHTLDDGSHVVNALRCVNCGHVMERMMNTYRQLQAEGVRQLKHDKYVVRGLYRHSRRGNHGI